MGMALTPAEKLQALNTPYVKYITSLLQQYIYPPEGGLWNYLQDWERARGKDFQNLATIMQIIEIWPEKKTNFGAASLQSYLRRTDPIEDDLKEKMEAALECMVDIARDYQEVAISAVSRRISPLGELTCLSRLVGGQPLTSRGRRVLLHGAHQLRAARLLQLSPGRIIVRTISSTYAEHKRERCQG
jgi:hypothetical protein